MALGPKPWTRLNRRLAVNKPDTEWFNAVTTALWTLDIIFSDDTNIAKIERPNADGSFWKIVLPRVWADFVGPDGVSINYNTSGELQQYGWETAADDDIELDQDYIGYKDGQTGVQQYVLGDTLASRIATWIGDNEDLAWSELSDTVGDPTQAANLGYIPVVTRYGAGPSYTYALALTDLSATGVGPFWVKGAAAADCYGEEIGNSSQVTTIKLDDRTLTNGAWKVDDTTVASSLAAAIEVAGGGKFGAGVYADKGAAAQAGLFVDGTNTVQLADGAANYGVDVTEGSGGINVHVGAQYCHGDVAGVTVANWFGGGILTGTPTEKLVSALNPGDKVLVL